jgi:hypothetical protein
MCNVKLLFHKLLRALKKLLHIHPLEIDPVIYDPEGPEWNIEAFEIARQHFLHPDRGD